MDIAPSGRGSAPESPISSRIKAAIARIGSGIVDGIRWVTRIRIPEDLHEEGLTPEIFKYLSKRFYEIVRRDLEVARSDPDATFLEVFQADGISADTERKQKAITMLIGEFGFENNQKIVAFLKDHLTPLPGGISWSR